MSEFDSRARDWDSNPVNWERSGAIAQTLLKLVPVKPEMKALEFGAGTGILSFLLSDNFSEITMMDNSGEMVRVMNEKVINGKLKNLNPLLFDLELYDYHAHKFDCVFSQMVLHHISNTKQLLSKFYQILSPGGYLAIADLYPEDGSFHGEGFTGHKGFDVSGLKADLENAGFAHLVTQQCYVIKKTIDNSVHEFPVFLLVAMK
jgi:ubiquinone/menaquinone biosynthesis C-methylase UbiE